MSDALILPTKARRTYIIEGDELNPKKVKLIPAAGIAAENYKKEQARIKHKNEVALKRYHVRMQTDPEYRRRKLDQAQRWREANRDRSREINRIANKRMMLDEKNRAKRNAKLKRWRDQTGYNRWLYWTRVLQRYYRETSSNAILRVPVRP